MMSAPVPSTVSASSVLRTLARNRVMGARHSARRASAEQPTERAAAATFPAAARTAPLGPRYGGGTRCGGGTRYLEAPKLARNRCRCRHLPLLAEHNLVS